jgi:hypothetical protein
MARTTFSYTHGDVGTAPDQPLDFQKGGRPDAQKFDWWWSSVIGAINDHASEFSRLDSDDDGRVDAADHALNADQATNADNAGYATDANATEFKNNDLDTDGDGRVDAADHALEADDAALLGGSTAGEVRPTVSEGETVIESGPTGINFGGDINVTSDGDGTVTVSLSTISDTHTSIEDDGTSVDTSPEVLDFGTGISVANNGGGHLTINANRDAETVDGWDKADIKNWVNTNSDVPNADFADTAGDANNLGGRAASGYTKLKDGVVFPVYASKSDVPAGIREGEAVYISGEGLFVEDGT